MPLPELKIGHLKASLPVIQGGMGVRVSKANLAAAVAKEGCVGVISTVGLGKIEGISGSEFVRLNEEALRAEIRKARSMTDGVIGVNVLAVLSHYESLTAAAAAEGADLIISGAGLPLDLPGLVSENSTKCIPIVSSARALSIICRKWKRDNRAPDAVVVAAFGQILRPHVLDLPPLGCINVHASLLPRWRGAAPIQYAIQAGDTETGITLMKMDVGLDTGPLYVQEAVPITGTDTAATLHDRLALLGGEMLRRHLDGILTSRIPPQPQDDNQATYAPLIKKEAGEIDWSADSAAIDRHIRAMTPWPSAFTTWAGTQLKIFPATPLAHSPAGAEPGRVIADGERILVAAGKGCLQIHTVQLSGRKALPVEEFINGHPHFAGSRLS